MRKPTLSVVIAAVTILALAGCNDATAPKNSTQTRAVPTTIEAIGPLELVDTAGKTIQVTILVKDQFGTPMFNVSVSARTATGEVPEYFTGAHTDSNGTAKLGWQLGERAGTTYHLTVTAGTASMTFRATPVPGQPVRLLELTPPGLDGATNVALRYPMTGKVTDAYYNPLKGVTLDVAVRDGGGFIERSSVVTDESGTFNAGTWTLGPSEGLQHLRVSTGNFAAEFSAYAEACVERTASGSCHREVAFVNVNNDERQIYRVNYDGTELTQLTRTGWNRSPSWSPDGERLAFIKFYNDSSFLVIADAGGSEIHRVKLNDPEKVEIKPLWSVRWSPDGRTLLLGWEYNQAPRLYLTSADDPGELRMIADKARSAAWSSDGSTILFVISGGPVVSHDALGIMNADGSGATQLTATGGTYERPVWYPGSSTQFLVPMCAPACIMAKGDVRQAQAGLTEVSQMSAFITDLTWSPDGRILGAVDWSSDEADVVFQRPEDFSRLYFYPAHLIASNAMDISWRPRPK